jgi:RNA polymerase sigma factor (sigma-70 family)
VAQDVALAAYLNFEAFHDHGHFAAWCLKRARWLALDRLRATGRVSERLTTEASDDASQEVQTWLGEVMDVVAKLPAAQRDALKLSVEGYSAAEIAAHLGVTEATVRSLRRHARLNLLRRLSVEDFR